MSRKSQNQYKRSFLLAAAVVILLFLFWNKDSAKSYVRHQLAPQNNEVADIDLPNLLGGIEDTRLPCANLPGAADVVVVVKTGFTVAQKRLPMHIETTYRCIPNLLIYSDAEQTIAGHKIHDALADLAPSILDSSDDFQFYRKIKEAQSAGLKVSDVSSKDDIDTAWRLDKWKNIPLLVKAAEYKPDAKWYIFIDADTYPVWSNMLHWLSRKNHNKRIYLGCQAWIGDTVFGHGGSGYILSNAAMRAAKAEIDKDTMHYYNIPDSECCGDVAVAVLLRDYLDLNLTTSWPMIQGETPGTLDYTQEKWCKTVVSYHHVDADEVDALWRFEQHWLRWMGEQQQVLGTGGAGSGTEQTVVSAPPILHRDIYDYFVAPLMRKPIMNWDNMSRDRTLRGAEGRKKKDNEENDDENNDEENKDNDENQNEDEEDEETEDHTDYWNDADKVAHTSFANCKKACEADEWCLGYSYLPGECHISHVIRLGGEAKGETFGMRSGWMPERIEQKRKEWGPCEED